MVPVASASDTQIRRPNGGREKSKRTGRFGRGRLIVFVTDDSSPGRTKSWSDELSGCAIVQRTIGISVEDSLLDSGFLERGLHYPLHFSSLEFIWLFRAPAFSPESDFRFRLEMTREAEKAFLKSDNDSAFIAR